MSAQPEDIRKPPSSPPQDSLLADLDADDEEDQAEAGVLAWSRNVRIVLAVVVVIVSGFIIAWIMS